MNSIIKVIFPLLLIIFNISLYSKDLVIKIPQKFHRDTLPLPPFPTQSVNKLEVIDNSKNLNLFNVRDLKQNKIKYKYYFGVLNLDLSNEYLLDGQFGFGSDNSSIHTYLNSVFTNNHFRFDLFADYNTEPSNTYIAYFDYRFPVEFETKIYPRKLGFETEGEYRTYNRLFNLLLGYQNSIYLDLYLKANTFINPNLKLKYDENVYIDYLSNISKYFSIGGYYVNSNVFPKVNYQYYFKRYKLNFKTDIEEDILNYSLTGSLNKEVNPGIGFAYNIDTAYQLQNPEIVFKLDYKKFNSDIRVWENYFKSYLSFINEDITSIISLKLTSLYNYKISYEQIYKNLSLTSNLDRIHDKLEYGFTLGYKVVL